MSRTLRSILFLTLLLLTAAPTPSRSISYYQYRSLFSLAHSLMTSVANLRASRGDLAGSARARVIADKLERGLGLGFWGLMWSGGWDYARNYAWKDLPYTELYGTISDMNELLRCLGELTRAESGGEKSLWVGRNYQNVLKLSESLSRRLLKVFGQSGASREVMEGVKIEVMEVMETMKIEVVEMMEMMKLEVMDGSLLRDCLDLGSNDLKRLIQVMKDILSQFYPPSNRDSDL